MGFLKVCAFKEPIATINMIFCQYAQKVLLNEFNVIFNEKF
jgi:hypothetical protein